MKQGADSMVAPPPHRGGGRPLPSQSEVTSAIDYQAISNKLRSAIDEYKSYEPDSTAGNRNSNKLDFLINHISQVSPPMVIKLDELLEDILNNDMPKAQAGLKVIVQKFWKDFKEYNTAFKAMINVKTQGN